MVTFTATSAADRAHRAVRLHEARVIDAVPRRLDPHGGPPGGCQCVVVGTRTHEAPKVGLVTGEQAVADLAVGSEPGAVTRRAERGGGRGDDAHLAATAVALPQLGRRRTARHPIRS